MCSRTSMKQQIMREMVLAEEKPHKGNSNVLIGNYNNSYKGSYNSISQNSDTLPSLTTTMIGSDKSYLYCKPYMNSPNRMSFNIDSNNQINDDLPFILNDYNDPISSTESPYLLHNIYPLENKYSLQSFNTDFSLQSPLIDTNIESNNSYNSQYQQMGNNKPGLAVAQMNDMYGYKTSFSCPVTGDQMSATSANQRRMSNSNSAVIGNNSNTSNMSLTYDDKRIQLKDRSKKESHNRIERKRRDFINQQIVELSNLLPPQMMTEGESKKNKGNILKNSVVYIQHLQNETNNTSNYLKETDMAFTLVDSYRKQIQELHQQIKSGSSQNPQLSVDGQRFSDNYSEYVLLREHNRKTYHANNQLLLPVNNSNNNLSSDMLHRGSASSYIKSPLSSVENGSAFKAEPSSAHSSIGNNSMSNTYRIDEETDAGFQSLHDMLSPTIPNQNMSLNYPSAPSKRNDIFFNTSNHYQGLGKHKYESMEC